MQKFFSVWVLGLIVFLFPLQALAANSWSINENGSTMYQENTSTTLNNRTNFTYEAWFYLTATSSLGSWIVGERTTDGAFNGVYVADDGIGNFLIYGTLSQYSQVLTGSAVSLNTWTHLALVVDNNTDLRLYENGTLVASHHCVDYVIDCPDVQMGTAGFAVGAFDMVGAETGYFAGQIDEVRYWTTALTTSTIQAQKNTELCGTESNLLAYWRFEQNTDDTSPSALTLTAQGGGAVYSSNVPFSTGCGGVTTTTVNPPLSTATFDSFISEYYTTIVILVGAANLFALLIAVTDFVRRLKNRPYGQKNLF